ncbi:MAG: MFS transporter [Sedimentisphaeraceae bacterium JB056]
MSDKIKTCSTGSMVTYSFGECANSLTMNTIFGFAMFYYTEALGLSFSLAGLAMMIATIWDAVSDPIMGFVTDNTKSRFGKRHPYILFGGLMMALSFYFIWAVPDVFKTSNIVLFGYLVVMNLFLRTAITVFIIPYTALGFEMCSDYYGRTKLQSIRNILNMAANVAGPGLAWLIFFPEIEGREIRAKSVAQNYVNMGTIFTIAIVLSVIVVVYFTRKYIVNSKNTENSEASGSNIKYFLIDMKEILFDVNSKWMFLYIFVVVLGIVLVSSLQIYLYEHFMLFSGLQKTIAHSSSMVGSGIGAIMAVHIVKRLDKKKAVYFAVIWAFCCNLILAIFYLGKILNTSTSLDLGFFQIPIGFIVFVIFHAGYWLGNGIMFPIATSMMADVSEVNEIKTGVNKDGGYSAVFSLAMKLSMSVGLFLSGIFMSAIGFVAGSEEPQSPEAIWRLCLLTLIAGPVVSIFALIFISKYPINSLFLQKLRLGERV